MRELRARGLKKTYPHKEGRLTVFDGLDFAVALDGITVVLGESGCGKTTLLRIAGGLEKPDAGSVTGLDRSKTAFVFQEPRLFPWLNVVKNVMFGMRKSKRDEARAMELLRLVGLGDFAQSRPAALSGGMSQRAALARALGAEPEYLLMDEPFSALDPVTRQAMRRLALEVRREKRVGMLFVTHSVDEALLLADTVLVMAGGVIKSEYGLNEFSFPRDTSEGGLVALREKIMDDLERKEAS